MKKTIIIKHQFLEDDLLKLHLETQTLNGKITEAVNHSQIFIKKGDNEKIEQYKVKSICDKKWNKSKK